jgi:hypothetical protein
VYYSTDDENFHIRELKARGIVTIIEDLKRTVPLGENKYEVPWYARSSYT